MSNILKTLKVAGAVAGLAGLVVGSYNFGKSEEWRSLSQRFEKYKENRAKGMSKESAFRHIPDRYYPDLGLRSTIPNAYLYGWKSYLDNEKIICMSREQLEDLRERDTLYKCLYHGNPFYPKGTPKVTNMDGNFLRYYSIANQPLDRCTLAFVIDYEDYLPYNRDSFSAVLSGFYHKGHYHHGFDCSKMRYAAPKNNEDARKNSRFESEVPNFARKTIDEDFFIVRDPNKRIEMYECPIVVG